MSLLAQQRLLGPPSWKRNEECPHFSGAAVSGRAGIGLALTQDMLRTTMRVITLLGVGLMAPLALPLAQQREPQALQGLEASLPAAYEVLRRRGIDLHALRELPSLPPTSDSWEVVRRLRARMDDLQGLEVGLRALSEETGWPPEPGALVEEARALVLDRHELLLRCYLWPPFCQPPGSGFSQARADHRRLLQDLDAGRYAVFVRERLFTDVSTLCMVCYPDGTQN